MQDPQHQRLKGPKVLLLQHLARVLVSAGLEWEREKGLGWELTSVGTDFVNRGLKGYSFF